jgi:hypothetical protein
MYYAKKRLKGSRLIEHFSDELNAEISNALGTM